MNHRRRPARRIPIWKTQRDGLVPVTHLSNTNTFIGRLPSWMLMETLYVTRRPSLAGDILMKNGKRTKLMQFSADESL